MQIIAGELKPGQKLNENDLASRFNISRHPLREAFRILESEYLVIGTPRKGVCVSEISIEDSEKLYRAREMAECYAIEFLKEDDIRSLPEVASALSSASRLSMPSKDNPEEVLNCITAEAEFHRKLIKATDNYWVIHFYNSISPHLARYLYLYLYIPDIRKDSKKEHQEILDLIKVGSFDEAKERMRVHIRNSHERLKGRILEFYKDSSERES